MSSQTLRRDRPSFWTGRNWWTLPASALFMAHLLVLTFYRDGSRELLLQNLFDLGFMLIAITVGLQAARRSRGLSRYVWRTAAICCGFFAFSLSLGVYEFCVPGHLSILDLSDYISVFWLAPLSFTLFLEPDFEPGRFDPLHILDFLQIVVFWIAIYFFFLFLPTQGRVGAQHSWLQATWAGSLVYDTSMALLFFLRSVLTGSRSTRRLFGRLSIYLVVAGLADFFANFYRLPSGTWYQDDLGAAEHRSCSRLPAPGTTPTIPRLNPPRSLVCSAIGSSLSSRRSWCSSSRWSLSGNAWDWPS